MNKNRSCKFTSIGGQALIEGIMMKSPDKTALAVRTPSGEIDISYLDEKSLREKYKFFALPVIRGVVAFIESLKTGYKAMMISTEKSGYLDEVEDKGKKDEKKDSKNNSALLTGIMTVATALGVALSVILFMYLPKIAVNFLNTAVFGGKITDITSVFEGIIKLIIFILYIWAITFMKDIKRVFSYHGAEHKTIFCYEAGLELTPENAEKMSRFHPRCGTSFMLLMILVSIALSLLVQNLWPVVSTVTWLWVIVKILMIPVICGLGFELLKICGRYDNIITKIISAPGLLVQRLTTKEPDRSMLEIAIAAMNAVLNDNDPLKIKEDKTLKTDDDI